MFKYVFFLGRKSLISVAELSAVLPQQTKYLNLTPQFLLAELPQEITEAQSFLNQLGGTTKIVRIDQETKSAHEVTELISDAALAKFSGREDKVRYAISMYSMAGTADRNLKNCLMMTKKKLKNAEISSRFINNNFQNPPTALLLGENVLGKGSEFCAIEIDSLWQVGETVAIQDIDAYSVRDFQRPERDPRLGMLPPKLAQIMINLSGIKSGETLYDPFCGIGTVLMEGVLMGLNVVGSDLDSENIKKCQKNLDWVFAKSSASGKVRLFDHDATRINKFLLPEKVSAIVSETFLGPPVSRTPLMRQIEENQSVVENLLANFLSAIHPLLPKDSTIVLTLMAYRDGKDFITLDRFHDHLERFGFESQPLIPGDLIEQFNMPEEAEYSLIYERPEQIVCREIIKIKPL